MTTEGATLYAQWTANDFALAFDANSGIGTLDNQTIAFDATATLSAIHLQM